MTTNTTFAQAVAKTPTARVTSNGMKTFESSLNANVDLFFQIGSSRGKDVTPTFERAYQEDRVTALRMAAWARDIRGGAGERDTFRKILAYVEKTHPQEIPQLVSVTSTFGRWDDLFALTSVDGIRMSFDAIKEALLVKQDALCAKWMPRKGETAVALRKHLGLTPKGYRKTLVTLTKVVETQMCARDWSNINYSHVPSVASARYQKAFGKQDPIGYTKFKADLVTGENGAKVNAAAVYPYDVVRSFKTGDAAVATAQWDALPNYIGDALVLPMCDVSGSMSCRVGGDNSKTTLTCMDVCVSLGLYLADKNTGPFKDMFLTFSEKSKIEVLRGNIESKINQLRNAEWGMSTNLNGAFEEVLRVATTNQVADADMPKYVLIMSDMEFDRCATGDTANNMIKRKYAAAGYTLPNIIFWNLNAHPGNSPVTHDAKGVALISGFSPAIMTAVLKAEQIDPVSIMLQAVNAERYQVIV